MQAAKTALTRGHKVTVFEENRPKSGAVVAGGKMRIKPEHPPGTLENLNTRWIYLARKGLEIKYSTPVGVKDLKGRV